MVNTERTAGKPDGNMSSKKLTVDAELEKLQRETFGYFLHETSPANGLVIDKSEVKATVSQLTPAERKARIAELEAKRSDRSGGS